MTSTTTIIRITGSKQPTPGPGSYNIPSDFGNAPKWSIKNQYPKKKRELLPGYNTIASTIGTGRKCAMSSRHQERDYTASPGPNYVPPKFGSEAQKSAFHIRTDKVPESLGSGPAQFNTSRELGGKQFTIKSRKYPPNDGEIPGPGPGKFYPDYSKTMRASTSNSIRPRYKEGKKEVTPGPNDYNIPRNLGTRSSCFHIKRREIKFESTPGPKYNNQGKIGDASPKYSLRSRIDTKKDIVDPPIVALPEVFGKARASALSSRHKERDYVSSPGPNYNPPPFGSGPKWTMVSRHEQKRDPKLEPPGPGQYSPELDDTSRKYTIASRAVPPNSTMMNPAPADYSPNYNTILRSSQMTSIRERPKEKASESNPGYVDLGSTLKGPAWTIGVKEGVDVTEGLV